MRARLCCAVLCIWLGFPAGATQPAGRSPEPSPPLVRLIATGGTISVHTGGRLSAEELLASVPTVERIARVEAEQFSNVSSGELTLRQWVDLSRRVNTLFRESEELAGIVVTSGTDTLEELAYFLHLTVLADRPVVVVGAMRNPSSPGAEGPANLLAAFRVAAAAGSRGKGALVVLNDRIHSAREVTKADAQHVNAFDPGPYGALGVVHAEGPLYHRAPLKRHTSSSEFDLADVEDLPRVDIVLTYQEAPGDAIRSLVDHGARGLVIAAAGAGSLSGTQGQGVRYATEKGVPVVIATRTGSGRVAAAREGTQDNAQPGPLAALWASRLAAEDLAPLKARILLMLALTRTEDRAEIQRIFREY